MSRLRNLALIGALFAATHASGANQSHQVVSSNGTTSIVERIDFPVGDIKDIIPAGDKYIIHANPIDSLKDSVAVDALFVMEKDQNYRAFGRTFSDEITSVAYVPSLDFATWSYKTQANTNVMEIKQGSTALHAAGSITNYVETRSKWRIASDAQLFASPSNTIFDIPSTSNVGYVTPIIHGFSFQNGQYVQSSHSTTPSQNEGEKLFTVNSQGVFAVIRESGMGYYDNFNPVVQHNITVPETSQTVSMAAIPDANNTNGHLILGNKTGVAVAHPYTIDSVNATPNASTQVFNSPINDMALTQDNTVQMVSTNDNRVVEVDANLAVLDRMTPSSQETGYRKVVAVGDNTLLLSNTHSNYFYRIKKVR